MALRVDQGVTGTGGAYVPQHVGTVFADAGYCGHSFNDGLLRFHDSVSGPRFREHLITAFPELERAKADVVAFDWNGRQLIATKQGRRGDPLLLIADIGRGDLMEVTELSRFAAGLGNDALIDATFEADVFAAWKFAVDGEGQGIPFASCVEYATPLYLGGSADVENLSLIDMDVSWSLGSQIWTQVRNLPSGTRVTIGDRTLDRS